MDHHTALREGWLSHGPERGIDNWRKIRINERERGGEMVFLPHVLVVWRQWKCLISGGETVEVPVVVNWGREISDGLKLGKENREPMVEVF